MSFSPLKTIAPLVLAGCLPAAGTSLVSQQLALARAPIEAVAETMITPLERVDGESTSGGAAQGEKPRQQSQLADVNPDLVKLAPGPIIRAIPVSKDCMVLSYLPDWNFGNVDNIGIGNNDGGVRTLLDWPAISPDEAKSADRRFLIALYSRRTISHPPASAIQMYEILDKWPEVTSWKTQPRYEADSRATCKFEPGDGWKLFDVTAMVRSRAKAGRDSHGVVLRFLKEDVSGGLPEVFSDYKLVSREGIGPWANCRPQLLVVKTSTSTAPRSN